MNPKFIRVYKKLDIDEIKAHILICGDLSASCGKCNAMSLKFDFVKCPECQTDFKYLAFRNIRENLPKLQKLSDLHKDITFVDFDDFKRISGAVRAEEFFK